MGAADVGTVAQVLQALGQLQLAGNEVLVLQGLLAKQVPPGECLRLIDEAAGRPPCPDCGGRHSHRCGHANGLQRYRCVACRRTFNALTGTPLARLRLRDKWPSYLQCLIEATTVRAAATRVAVAQSTSFRWRHRFIDAIRRE